MDDTSFISDDKSDKLFKYGKTILQELDDRCSCNGLLISSKKTEAVHFRAKS